MRKPAFVVKRKKRRLQLSAKPPLKETPLDKQRRYFMALINSHPNCDLIVYALQEGNSPRAIAGYFAEEKMLPEGVNENTFYKAVLEYRKVEREKCRPTNETIDGLVRNSLPSVDVEKELDKLFRLQKLRIAIDVKNEQTVGKLFNTTQKEVDVARTILETKAKVTGNFNGGGASGSSMDGGPAITASDEVRKELRRIREERSGSDSLAEKINALTKKVTKDGKKVSVTQEA